MVWYGVQTVQQDIPLWGPETRPAPKSLGSQIPSKSPGKRRRRPDNRAGVILKSYYCYCWRNLQDSIQYTKIFFFKEIILKKHAEKYGIATAFWMLLTVLECWNVHSSWKSDGRISRAVCWMRESQCATKWCAHVISPLHATLKFSWWHVDDTVSFRFRYSNYGLYI